MFYREHYLSEVMPNITAEICRLRQKRNEAERFVTKLDVHCESLDQFSCESHVTKEWRLNAFKETWKSSDGWIPSHTSLITYFRVWFILNRLFASYFQGNHFCHTIEWVHSGHAYDLIEVWLENSSLIQRDGIWLNGNGIFRIKNEFLKCCSFSKDNFKMTVQIELR